MSKVGIIANPASGKDIRRLVARGAVFSNNEKINIVQRILVGLAWSGVEKVVFMPDTFSIGRKALHSMDGGPLLPYRVEWLKMIVEGRQEDSTLAAELMRDSGVDCIITLGGDGTNRVVSKGCGDVPLLPLSTGTNNVFPYMMEGTTAGMAAGLVAGGQIAAAGVTFRTKRLDVFVNGDFRDVALVDAVVYDALFTGSKAIWEVARLKQIVTTWSEPGNIGMSSIAGSLSPVGMTDPQGAYLAVGEGGTRIMAPIAPGAVEAVDVMEHRLLDIGEEVEVNFKPSVIALDGEREVVLSANDRASIRLTDQGPYMIKPREVLAEAARRGLFTAS
jgi:predicted polyphosphate/ATP-dependent NAD kinase